MPGHLIDRTGETKVNNQGLKMMIIAYRNVHDIDVQFEDGSIVLNKYYSSFKNGSIANPNPNIPRAGAYKHRVGETSVATNGMEMCIIAYHSTSDIDVQFEDGTIVEHRDYFSFIKGHISNPNRPIQQNMCAKHIGETSIARNGLKMTIIAYRKSTDLDVQFEDGVIRTHRTYHSFKLGDISHPKHAHNMGAVRVGMTKTSTNGMKMSIIAYNNANDIDIQFEDGVVLRHQQYCKFESGHIRRRMQLPFQIGSVVATAYAYNYDQVINYYCKCANCGCTDIMTIDEMKSHICNI